VGQELAAGTVTLGLVLAFLLCGCIMRRAYSISVELEAAEYGIVQAVSEDVAANMNCRFLEAGHDPILTKQRKVRYCHPVGLDLVVVELSEEHGRFVATVVELNQRGPVRPEVQSYAQTLETAIGVRFGRERISSKRMNWRL
jgi:hypothetical protein